MSNRASWIRGAVRTLGLSYLASVLALAGCGDSGVGPLTPVQGKVQAAGQPLAAGDVKFWPTDANGPKAPIVGTIGSDGQYKMTTNGQAGVPKGKYKVTVNTIVAASTGTADPSKPMSSTPTPAGPPARLANAKYEAPDTTDLSIEVPSASYDLNLSK